MPGESQNFWDFSVELYGRDGVSAACLELQDEHGLDINLLLFCYWYACFHGVINDRLLQQLIKFSSYWKQSVAQPLRNVRKWMKVNAAQFEAEQSSQFEILRQGIKVDELAAEKYQQEAMENLIPPSIQAEAAQGNQRELLMPESSTKAARDNVEKLLAGLAESIELNAAIESKLGVINDGFHRQLKSRA